MFMHWKTKETFILYIVFVVVVVLDTRNLYFSVSKQGTESVNVLDRYIDPFGFVMD